MGPADVDGPRGFPTCDLAALARAGDSTRWGSRLAARLLLSGARVEDTLHEGEYHYYQLCLGERADAIRVNITLERLGGNPDLYVSLRHAWPSVASSDMLSAKLGTERIVFESGIDLVQRVLRSMAAADGSDGDSDAPLVPRVVYIAAFGKEEASAYRLAVQVAATAAAPAPAPAAATARPRPVHGGHLRVDMGSS